jgi:hypothetical protein
MPEKNIAVEVKPERVEKAKAILRDRSRIADESDFIELFGLVGDISLCLEWSENGRLRIRGANDLQLIAMAAVVQAALEGGFVAHVEKVT